jgi:hypothetical protein
MKEGPMIRILFVLLTVIFFTGGTVFAHEQDAKYTTDELHSAYEAVADEYSLFGGYRFVNFSGSQRVDEYEYLKDSVTLGGSAKAFQYPHRIEVDLDGKNSKDYFGEVRYGYKNIGTFRWINRTLFHNLENITLGDPTGLEEIRDAGRDYGVKAALNNFLFKARAPRFPLHFYVEGLLFDKEGEQQQRFLGGSGYFGAGEKRISEERDINWETRDYRVGINSHLNFLEADLSHEEKRFDASKDTVLFDTFTAASSRPAGEYPHNHIPNFNGSSDTLKIHTNYTGKLVGSATLTNKDKENELSGTKATYFFGAGALTWMPVTKLTCFFKYRHQRRNLDNPSSVTIYDRTDPSISYGSSSVRKSINATTDFYSGTLRYRPFHGMTLRSIYTFEEVDRSFDAADYQFLVEKKTRKSTLALQGDLRLNKDLKMKAEYRHKEFDFPAYNIQPNRSNEGDLSFTWTPTTRINSYLSYSIVKESRNDLHFPESDVPQDREVRKDRVLASVTSQVTQRFSATASYAYFRDQIKQDIIYGVSSGVSLPDLNVPYKTRVNNYAFNAGYQWNENLYLNAGVSLTDSTGSIVETHRDTLGILSDPNFPLLIPSLTGVRIKETSYTLSGNYELKKGVFLGADFQYRDFNDELDQVDDVEDGISRILLVKISKKW